MFQDVAAGFLLLIVLSAVWPDLAKFNRFGKYLKISGTIFKVYLVLGQFLTHFGTIFMLLGKFSMLNLKGQILKTQSGHLATLVQLPMTMTMTTMITISSTERDSNWNKRNLNRNAAEEPFMCPINMEISLADFFEIWFMIFLNDFIPTADLRKKCDFDETSRLAHLSRCI